MSSVLICILIPQGDPFKYRSRLAIYSNKLNYWRPKINLEVTVNETYAALLSILI